MSTIDVTSIQTDQELVATVAFDKVALDAFRARFPAHLDADDFHLIGHAPGSQP